VILGKASLGVMGSSLLVNSAGGANALPGSDFPKAPGLTEYVSRFVATTKYEEIPADVIELGKRSILDGLGLALTGSRAQTGALCRQYLEKAGVCEGRATIIGSSKRTSARFAAFVNGVSIHADDFDDTQLSAVKDRVYGLLVHPTVPVLPAIFALGEGNKISGKEFMLAYHLGVEVECKIAEAISPRHYQDGFHSTGTLRAVRLRCGLRKTASTRAFENSECFWSGCHLIGRPERKFWHHDQVVSGRSRRGERRRLKRSMSAPITT
jgi:hypothetical protein